MTTPATERVCGELEQKIAALVADLPNRFPAAEKAGADDRRTVEERRRANLDRHFTDWVKQQRAQAVSWKVLRPTQATANLPRLSVEDDGSIFASGDQSKRDVYTLRFTTDLKRITAIRLEVIPDDRLPRHGPGRVFYEGPFGDFFLSKVTVMAGGKSVPLRQASATGPNHGSIASAIDDDPQTGWTLAGGQGNAHAAFFHAREARRKSRRPRRSVTLRALLCGRPGRFRISVTTDARPIAARDLPSEIEALLLVPDKERTPDQTRATSPPFSDGRARAGQGTRGHRTASQADAGLAHNARVSGAPG